MPGRHTFGLLLGPFLAAFQILGCGGGSSVGGPPPVTFSLSPEKATSIDVGQTLAFTVVNDSSGKGVSWTLTGPGTLSNQTNTSVTYTPSASMTSASVPATITATSRVNSGVSQTVPLSVYPQPMFTTTTLPDGNVGADYYLIPPVTGGVGAFMYSVSGGSLPSGLSMSGEIISGIPKFPVQHYSFTLALTDVTDVGPFTTTRDFSIDILAPLPLMITTQPPLSPFGVNIGPDPSGFYDGDSLEATGGVEPYTFSLGTGSNPLPAGLTVAATHDRFGIISGTATAPGTSNVVIEVTDSQTPPMVSPPMTYSITINPSTNFIGTQPPGDVWQLAISHSDATDGLVMAADEGTNGLPITPSTSFTRTFSTVNTGFETYISYVGIDGCHQAARKSLTPLVSFCPVNVYDYAVEMRDQMILMQPFGNRTNDNVVAAVANACPQLGTTFPATAIYQFIALPTATSSATDASYGTLALAQDASNSYSLTFSAFQSDTTPIPSTMFTGVSCDSKSHVLSFTGANGNPVTVGISAAGALMIDKGTDTPMVGVRQPLANLPPNAILGAQYLGMVFEPTATGGSVAGSIPVGFGPGAGTSIAGGTYVNIDSDAFSAHAVDRVITLGANQTSPGLFTGGTLVIPGTATFSNFNVIVGQVNGKFVLFGASNAPSQQLALLLLQQ